MDVLALKLRKRYYSRSGMELHGNDIRYRIYYIRKRLYRAGKLK